MVSQWNFIQACPSATFPPQIPHDVAGDRTQAVTFKGQWLTAWAIGTAFKQRKLAWIICQIQFVPHSEHFYKNYIT